MKKNVGQIIRRYAMALYEATVESNEIEQVSSQAEGLSKIFTPEMVSFFVNPGIDVSTKKSLLQEVASASAVSASVIRFFELLLDNSRFLFVTEILKEFITMSDVRLGIARVNLIIPKMLSEGDCSAFTKALEETLKKRIIVTQVVDPALGAGCVVKIGNTLLDASLQARLQNIKESLSQGV